MNSDDDLDLIYAPGLSRPEYVSKRFFRIFANGKYKEHGFVPRSNKRYFSGRKGSAAFKNRKPKSSRSEAEFSLVLNMMNVGYSPQKITQVFEDFSFPANKYWGLKGESRKLYLESMFRKSRTYLRQANDEFKRALVDKARSVIFSRKYSSSQKATLIGLLNICRITRKFLISASVRGISIQSNLSLGAVSKSLKSLAIELRMSCSRNRHNANTFDLTDLSVESEIVGTRFRPYEWGTLHLDIPLSHDIFRSNGIGFLGWLILTLLYMNNHEAISQSRLKKLSGYSRSQFAKIFSELSELGLIRVESRKVRLAEFLDLDAAAIKLGVSGVTLNLSSRYKEERHAFHEDVRLLWAGAIERAGDQCRELRRNIFDNPALSPFQQASAYRKAMNAAISIELRALSRKGAVS